MDKDLRVAMIAIVAAVILAAGLGFYFATITSVRAPSSAATDQNSSTSKPYHLVLVEPMNTVWNASVAQPRFFVLGNNGLESSANISLPAKTLIELSIISYDTPTPGSTVDESKVTGTVGNSIYMINSTVASMSDPTMQWGMNVSSVPVSSLAQTFSIPSLNINVPVPGGDMVTGP